jgi:hypothetical protein
MSLFQYPNQRFTSQIGLALYGMDEILAENMLLIDAAYAAGSSININGSLVTAPNFNNTTPAAPGGDLNVVWQFDVNGNISAYVPVSGVGSVTSFSAGNLSPLFTTSVANPASTPALSFALSVQNSGLVFAGPAIGVAAAPTFRALVASDIPALPYLPSGTVLPVTTSRTAHSFFTTYSALTGAFGQAQPVVADLADTPAAFQVLAGPAVAGPAATATFRALVAGDIPALAYVTSFSAGNIDSIVTSSVATATTTPALTFALATQTANTVWAGPVSGGVATPTFRALVTADLPAGTSAWSSLTGTLSNGQVIPYADAGISRLGAASLALGNGTAGDFTGNLKLKSATFQGQTAGQPAITVYGSDSCMYIGTNSYNDAGIWFNSPSTPTEPAQAAFGGGSTYTVFNAVTDLYFEINANTRLYVSDTGAGLGSGVPLKWASTTSANGTPDSGISRLSAASLALGNGTAGDATGKLVLAKLKATGLTVYLSNALAILGGLAAGDFYRTGADPDVVCVVH